MQTRARPFPHRLTARDDASKGKTMTIHGPTSNSFISQRLRLHYVDWGNPGAPPLILQHGGRDHCRSWDWVAEELAKDWHVIAPDLRGHGDSAWAPDGNYEMNAFVYDFAQLVHTLGYDEVTIVAHSLGGNVASRYAGLYPEKVRRFVNIEGLGPSPKSRAEREAAGYANRFREWIDKRRAAAGRIPRRYPSIEAAYARMKEENSFLTDEQARHLTIHGASRNEDGTWSWKFDPYLNVWPFEDVPEYRTEELWAAITCPMLLLYGANSWASNPEKDGRLDVFNNDPKVIEFENAGHWLHHDQFDRFMAEIRAFL
ncbi:MAG: alpha/beta hydrolase [Brevundimonas sp.]|jgi:pimeloyl-ACP methyl ester carboxylesterase|nr:alpha/beta hydrolase [Brevundimonas sp.]